MHRLVNNRIEMFDIQIRLDGPRYVARRIVNIYLYRSVWLKTIQATDKYKKLSMTMSPIIKPCYITAGDILVHYGDFSFIYFIHKYTGLCVVHISSFWDKRTSTSMLYKKSLKKHTELHTKRKVKRLETYI